MPTGPRIIADRDIPYLRGVLEPYARVAYLPGAAITHEDAAEAEVILTRTRTRCDAALLEGTPVELIATATIGYDHIDTAYCNAHGIEVATAAGCNARGVLQYVVAALLALSRRDGWKPGEKTLGVVGVGHVGELVYEYGRRFGFRVLGCDPPRQRENPALPFLPLDQFLPLCDIVSLHIPLTTTGETPTRGMADRDFFVRLKPGAILLNTSRGSVLCDGALREAIDRSRVAHAVIDTWNHEPHIDRALLEAATLTTPHIAGYTRQGKANATAAVVQAVARRYDLPLQGWYPPGETPGHPDEAITWDQAAERMIAYFDIEAQSASLKAHPEAFESLRNDYLLRTEFF